MKDEIDFKTIITLIDLKEYSFTFASTEENDEFVKQITDIMQQHVNNFNKTEWSIFLY